LDQLIAQGSAQPGGLIERGQQLICGLRALAEKHGVPLQIQGADLVFHAGMLKPGAAAGTIQSYRDYVQRHDAPRWAHLRRCLLEEGVRAIERGLWFLSFAHSAADVEEALRRAEPAFARHAGEWKA
jgi:glutamate-1-semialdehyde 2,1-aminomutase